MGVISSIRKKTGLKRPARSLLGIFDFSYQHFALGDVLTSQVKMAIKAIQHGCDGTDLIVAIDPGRPAAPMQTHIDQNNYIYFLDNLFPAFLCTPQLRSIKLIRERLTFNHTLSSYLADGLPTWPSMKVHMGMRHIYPLDHADINAFYEKERYVPKLGAPRGYDGWAKSFLRKHLQDRLVVVINPRQSAFTSAPAVTQRDAPLTAWFTLLDHFARTDPRIIFILVGSYSEADNSVLRLRNVYVPRANGFHLGHELALLANAHAFVGTSSGFAAFATFSSVPYLILNVEGFFAQHAGIQVGARHYPFATADQVLTWHLETADLLREDFLQLRDMLDVRGASTEGRCKASTGETV